MIKIVEPPEPEYKLSEYQKQEMIALKAACHILNEQGFNTKVVRLWVSDTDQTTGYIEMVRL
jgi:hypothetical protein